MATTNNENAPPKGRKMSIAVHTSAGDTAAQRPDRAPPTSNIHLLPRSASQRRNEKAKSLTEAELTGQVITDAQVAQINTQLQAEEPPLSLDESRQRAASIEQEKKMIRKNSVTLLRARTTSRAAALGVPDPGAQGSPQKGSGVPRPVAEDE